TYTTPSERTARWRAGPTPSWNTEAQNPSARVKPPFSGSQVSVDVSVTAAVSVSPDGAPSQATRITSALPRTARNDLIPDLTMMELAVDPHPSAKDGRTAFGHAWRYQNARNGPAPEVERVRDSDLGRRKNTRRVASRASGSA